MCVSGCEGVCLQVCVCLDVKEYVDMCVCVWMNEYVYMCVCIFRCVVDSLCHRVKIVICGMANR